MRRNCILIWINILLFVSASEKEINNNCERCVKVDECPSLAHLNKLEQQLWLEQVPCEGHQTTIGSIVFGVSANSEGDYVCCPNSNISENENKNGTILPNSITTKRINKRSPYRKSHNNNRWQYDDQKYEYEYEYEYGNRNNRLHLGDQCAKQGSLLPSPQSQCCGPDILYNLELSGAEMKDVDPFPWSVYLLVEFKNGISTDVFNCGGSLISRRYVLTAAHCVFRPESKLKNIDISIAEYDSRCYLVYENGIIPDCITDLYYEEVIIHPEFYNDNLEHDIALVRLKKHGSTRHVPPICLPTFDVEDIHHSIHSKYLPLEVAAWDTDPAGYFVKLSTEIHYVAFIDCHKFYQHLSKSQLCASGRNGQDARKGDSGGPLMMIFEGNYYIIGIVSGKKETNETDTIIPSLYTDVYSHMSWIWENVRR